MTAKIFDNNSSGNFSVGTYGLVLSPDLGLNSFQLAYGVLIFFLNASFLILLFHNRHRISRKRYIFVANLAFCDLLSSIALIALASAAFADWSGLAPFIILDTALSSTAALIAMSYNLLLRVQYLAVRKPLQYRVKATKRNISIALILVWIFANVYAGVKAYMLCFEYYYTRALAIFEFSTGAMFCCCNSISFGYVLYVATKNRKDLASPKKHCQRDTADALTAGADDGERWRTSSIPSRRDRKGSCRFLVTTGIGLVIYWIGYVPFYVDLFLTVLSEKDKYFERGRWRHIAFLMCLLRSIWDPISHFVREPKLRVWSWYS